LKVKRLYIEAGGKPIVLLNKDDADDLGVRALGRVRLKVNGHELTAIVNTTFKVIDKGVIGVYEEVASKLNLEDGSIVDVSLSEPPKSIFFIREKLKGKKLTYGEIYEIVKDVVEGNLSEVEISAFVTALHTFGLDLDEATNLSIAMVKVGETLDLGDILVVDKHSIGGVPGDKTSLVAVPTIAAAGLTIPKTSSRAITSAAGTADRAEVLMPVALELDEIRSVVLKTGGCLVWGGALHLSPADDIFVRVEYPLAIDPLLLPSIMSKKKAVNAKMLVIDIPTGRGTKVKTIGEANALAKDFIELGRRLGIQTGCAVTYGEQPVGYAVGPALEAREALETLMGSNRAVDLVSKAANIAGVLFKMAGVGDAETALQLIRSGKSEKKFREIIAAQGGDPDVKPDDIPIGDKTYEVRAKRRGRVLWIDNGRLVEVARAAGAPKDKGAGILLNKKIGEHVDEGELLYTVYSESSVKLQNAIELIEARDFMGIGRSMDMLIQFIAEPPVYRRRFELER